MRTLEMQQIDVVDATFRNDFARVVRVVRPLAATGADAEDAVAEAFARAVDVANELTSEDHCASWVVVTARRLLIDQSRSAATRKRACSSHLDDWAMPSGDDPEVRLLLSEQGEQIAGCLAELSETDRTLLWMRDAHGAPVSEAARAVGVTHGSASVLLSRARRRFARSWEGVAAAAKAFQLWVCFRVLRGRNRSEPLAMVQAASAAVVAPMLLATSLLVVGSLQPAPSVVDQRHDLLRLAGDAPLWSPVIAEATTSERHRQDGMVPEDDAHEAHEKSIVHEDSKVGAVGVQGGVWRDGADEAAAVEVHVQPAGEDGTVRVSAHDVPPGGPTEDECRDAGVSSEVVGASATSC